VTSLKPFFFLVYYLLDYWILKHINPVGNFQGVESTPWGLKAEADLEVRQTTAEQKSNYLLRKTKLFYKLVPY